MDKERKASLAAWATWGGFIIFGALDGYAAASLFEASFDTTPGHGLAEAFMPLTLAQTVGALSMGYYGFRVGRGAGLSVYNRIIDA